MKSTADSSGSEQEPTPAASVTCFVKTCNSLKRVWDALGCTVWFSPVLMLADILSDFLVISSFYHNGHSLWGSTFLALMVGGLLLVFAIPTAVLGLLVISPTVFFGRKHVKCGEKFRECSLATMIALVGFPIVFPIGFSLTLHYFDVKPLWNLRKGCAPDKHVTPTVVLARLFRPTLTSTPQFVLQLCVALLARDTSLRVLISMAIGGISILFTTSVFSYKISAKVASHRWETVYFRTLAVVLLEFSAIFCISSSIAIFEKTALYGEILVYLLGVLFFALFNSKLDDMFGDEERSAFLRRLSLLPPEKRWRHLLTIAKVATPAVFAFSALPFTFAAFCYDSSDPNVHNLAAHLVGCAGVFLFVFSIGFSYAGYGKPFAFQVYCTSEEWPEKFFPFNGEDDSSRSLDDINNNNNSVEVENRV